MKNQYQNRILKLNRHFKKKNIDKPMSIVLRKIFLHKLVS